MTSGMDPDRLRELQDGLEALDTRLKIHFASVEAGVGARWRTMPDSEDFFRVAYPIVTSGRTLLDLDRLYLLWQAARNASRLDAPVAEIGSYKGGSARFLAQVLTIQAAEPVDLHAFDTFGGHPEESLSDIDSDDHRDDVFTDTASRT